jgi:hypothetical protein
MTTLGLIHQVQSTVKKVVPIAKTFFQTPLSFFQVMGFITQNPR